MTEMTDDDGARGELLAAARQDTIVIIEPTSRGQSEQQSPDTATLLSSVVPGGDSSDGPRQLVRQKLVTADSQGQYILEFTVPDDGVDVIGGEITVAVLLPRSSGPSDPAATEIVSVTPDPDDTVIVPPGRTQLSWTFTGDPDLQVIYRYLTGR